MAYNDCVAIRNLFHELGRAVGAGELGALEKLLDLDAREFAPGVPVLESRAVILNRLGREQMTCRQDLRLDCAEVVAETEWGFCTGTYGLRSVCLSTDTVRYTDGKFVAVVHRGEKERWRLYRICYNSNLPGGKRADSQGR